jgi:ribonucleoside-diphosphate reductase alpha chain
MIMNPMSTAGDAYVPRRRRLADERKAITHKFQIAQTEGYVTVGLYEDGQPGEVFISLSKEGSSLAGLMDSFATAISIGLQYGVPLKVLVNKFVHARYEPSGPTQNPNIPQAKSIVDYIFRWLALKFLTPEDRQSVGLYNEAGQSAAMPPAGAPSYVNQSFLNRIEGQI